MTPQEKKERLAEALVQEKERLAGVTKAFITYEDGRTAEGDVICTFDSKDTGFQYFLFRDLIRTKLAKGLIFKKPLLELCIGGIREVRFE